MKAKITDPYSEYFDREVEVLGGITDMKGNVNFDIKFPNGTIKNFPEEKIELIK
ncbi:MAG: hypothetical protein RIC57_03355 [Balneola sp.]